MQCEWSPAWEREGAIECATCGLKQFLVQHERASVTLFTTPHVRIQAPFILFGNGLFSVELF